MATQVIYARLANDPSTVRSLFTGSFMDISNVTLQLSEQAQGTANFAIFENGVQKIDERVVAGGNVSWQPQAGSKVEFYVNYYDASDLADAIAIVS